MIQSEKIVITNFSTNLLNKMGLFVPQNLFIDRGFIVEKNEILPDYHIVDAGGLELLPAFIDLSSDIKDSSQLIDGGVGVALSSKVDIDENGFRAFAFKKLLKDGEVEFDREYGFISDESELKTLTNLLHYLKSADGRFFCFPYANNYADMNDSLTASISGLDSSDDAYEAEIIFKNLLAVEKSGVRASFEVSTKRGLELLIDAKKRGLEITISVSMMNLLFVDENCKNFDTLAKVKPHLRSQNDIDFIIKNFEYVDFLSIKHIDLDKNDKNKVFHDAKFGSSNAGFIVPMAMEIASRYSINVGDIFKKISTDIAKIWGQKVSLSAGEPARVILVDKHREIVGEYQHLWQNQAKTGSVATTILKNNIFSKDR